MSTLYELTENYKTVLEMTDDPAIDPQCIIDTLEAISGEIEDKADGYAKVIKEAEGRAVMLTAEIDRLTERKKAIALNVSRMKDSLKAAMQTVGKEKIKTDLFSFGIQKNPPSVAIDKPEDIPGEFLIQQEPKIDKKAILSAIKDGAQFDFAHIEQSESVRIR